MWQKTIHMNIKIIIGLVFLTTTYLSAQKKILITAKDSLKITADLYKVNDTAQWMVLCHQAGYSRGEYIETAKNFNALGYNCLALDQRSGKEVNGIKNETAIRAAEKKLGQTYLDAEQDIIAAVDYAYKLNKKKPIILIGSSYSASLTLKILVQNNKVKAAFAFSPGEYFGDKFNLRNTIKSLIKPAFVTSSRDEARDLMELTKDMRTVEQFIPNAQGDHGSKVLWSTSADKEEYWNAVKLFLKTIH